MRILLLSSILFLGYTQSLLAMIEFTKGDIFTERDISNSCTNIRRVFEERYKPDEVKLYEVNNQRPIGTVSYNGNKISFVYRGTYGLEELKTSLDRNPLPINQLGFNADCKGHQGYCLAYNSFRDTVIKTLDDLVKKTHLSLNDFEIDIDAYSRGGSFAALTALDIEERAPRTKIRTITFAGSNTFDEMGAAIYNSYPGNSHLNFVAEEDIISQYPNLSSYGLGRRIGFFAKDLQEYQNRVSQKAYTNLDPSIKHVLQSPLGVFGISLAILALDLGEVAQFLLPPIWEAHVDKTYEIGAPQALRAYYAAEQ